MVWLSELRYFWTDLDIIFERCLLACNSFILDNNQSQLKLEPYISSIHWNSGSLDSEAVIILNSFITFLFELWFNADHCKSNHFSVDIMTVFLYLGIHFTHSYLRLLRTFSVSSQAHAFWPLPLELFLYLLAGVPFD